MGKTHVLNVIFALTRDEGAAVRRRIVDLLFFLSSSFRVVVATRGASIQRVGRVH